MVIKACLICVCMVWVSETKRLPYDISKPKAESILSNHKQLKYMDPSYMESESFEETDAKKKRYSGTLPHYYHRYGMKSTTFATTYYSDTNKPNKRYDGAGDKIIPMMTTFFPNFNQPDKGRRQIHKDSSHLPIDSRGSYAEDKDYSNYAPEIVNDSNLPRRYDTGLIRQIIPDKNGILHEYTYQSIKTLPNNFHRLESKDRTARVSSEYDSNPVDDVDRKSSKRRQQLYEEESVHVHKRYMSLENDMDSNERRDGSIFNVIRPSVGTDKDTSLYHTRPGVPIYRKSRSRDYPTPYLRPIIRNSLYREVPPEPLNENVRSEQQFKDTKYVNDYPQTRRLSPIEMELGYGKSSKIKPPWDPDIVDEVIIQQKIRRF